MGQVRIFVSVDDHLVIRALLKSCDRIRVDLVLYKDRFSVGAVDCFLSYRRGILKRTKEAHLGGLQNVDVAVNKAVSRVFICKVRENGEGNG